MRAVVITRSGNPSVLQLQEVADPESTGKTVLIRVKATAVNRADLLQRQGLYPPPPGTRGDIPGLEFAGIIEECAPAAGDLKKGDRVMGLLSGEAYSELVTSPPELLMPIPENLGFEEAAAIPEAFLTAYDALILQLGVKAGEKLLLHAVGSGVGSAALQLAREKRVFVIGTSRSDFKLELAKSLGLDIAVNSQSADFQQTVMRETHGEGVDALLDLVGACYWPGNLASLASCGRIIVVGLLGGSRIEVDLGFIMRKRLHIIGTVLRSRNLAEKVLLTQRFREDCLHLFASNTLHPIVDRVFSWREAAQAHAYLEENRNFGKVVLAVE